jgi:site-specific recombinase XerD
MKSVTQAEIVAVIRAAEGTRNRAMICLGYRHGMRTSEICGLRLEDIDFRNNEITIRRLKGSMVTTQPLVDQPGEPLLSEKRLLRAWLNERGVHGGSPYVFTSQKSGRINRSQFYRIFSEAAEKAGLSEKKRNPHLLKHSLAVSLVTAGVDLASIRVALGHRNISSTSIYALPSDEVVGRKVTSALLSLG